MKHKVAIVSDFDFDECLWFLNRGHNEPMHRIMTDKVRKAIEIEGQKLLLEVGGEDNALWYEVLNTKKYNNDLVESYIISWFDLKRDLGAFYDILHQDPDLAFMEKSYRGLRLMGIENLFEVLVWSIIGQQINLTFAYKIKNALVQHIDSHILYQNHKYYLFPTPQNILDLSIEDFEQMKFSRQKIQYIKYLAESFVNRILSDDNLFNLNGLEEKLKYLTQFKGVGEWTAQYCLMKFGKEMDAVPFGDAGINQALEALKGIPKKNSRGSQVQFYEGFIGYKAYMTLYLWRWLSEKARIAT